VAITRIDPDELLLAYLTTDARATELRSLVTAPRQLHIYGPPLGVPSGVSSPRRLVSFGNDGSSISPQLPVAGDRVTFWCYGSLQSDAMLVYRALHDAMNGAYFRLAKTGCVWLLRTASQLAGPYDIPEPEIGWPRVVAAYQINYLTEGLPT
jgi:hypothetical protein